MKILSKYLNHFSENTGYIYRGHANHEWELKPSIGRHFKDDWKHVVKHEKEILENFKKRALPYLKLTPGSDIEWLCLMQHYGCATRLIDFTSNPLIALFFASDPIFDTDGLVYISTFRRTYEGMSDINVNIFEREQNFVYHPPHITERIIGQSGCFLYSRIPNKPLLSKQLREIRVAKNDKRPLRQELQSVGISHSSLFPGLDGISKDLTEKLVVDFGIVDMFL